MPDNIVFNDIPVGIRTPGHYIEIDNSRAVRGLPQQDRKLLVIGQRVSTGTVAELVPTRVTNADAAEAYAGRGSFLHAALLAALKGNPDGDIWMIAQDDLLAGAVATADITIGGTITGSGTLYFLIAGIEVPVGVAAGETPAEVATKVAAAINAKTELPLTAAVNGSTAEQVDLTCRHKGENGNDIDLRANYYQGQELPKGLTLAMTAFSGGTGNPDVNDAIDAMGDDQYYSIVSTYSDASNMGKIESEMTARFGPMQQIAGHVFIGKHGTHGDLSTYGSARNSLNVSGMGAYDVPNPPWVWAATLAGVCDRSGAIDPARPMQTLRLPGILPPPEESRLTRAERDLLLHDGISTFTVDAGGNVLIERVITMYQKNAFNIDDPSFLDLNTVWTVDYVRYAFRARYASRFPRHKLADDGTRFNPGQSIVTPSLLKAEGLALFRELEEAGLVENYAQFKKEFQVVRSTADRNRVNSILPLDIINQFRVFAAAVQFRL